MSCPICNQPDYIQCNCSSEPFCDTCTSDSKCIQKVDAECVIYHRDDDKPSKLTCMGVPNKTSVESILETIDGFICNINTTQTPITPIDSPSVDLTAWGVLRHTLQADVNISSASGNTLTILEDGLYAPQVPLTPIDSNSVNLTAFGTLDHTLQADVVISPDEGNALVIRDNGLFADSSGNTITADNGLTKTANNVQLGGTLTHETSLQLLSYGLNILTNSGHFNITDGSYNFNIINGTAPSDLETRLIITAAGTVLQTTNNANAALISYYMDNFITSGGGQSIIATHYPTTDDLLFPPPVIDPDLTSYVKTSLDGAGSTGLIEIYSKAVVLNQITNTVDNTGTDAQSNVLYTNSSGKICSAPILAASAVLNFPNTSSNGSSDLTISVPGAVDGDIVAIGVPAASAASGTFWGFVSAADTVTIRFHNTSGGSVDPASGTFKVKVFKG